MTGEREFQSDVIDRLARIETKQDSTTLRVNALEESVQELRDTRAEHRGAGKLAMGVAGLFGAGATEAIRLFFRR